VGMSTHVDGIKAPDAKWKKMKKVWDICREAGVAVPQEVDDYFEDAPPDDQGVVVELEGTDAVSKYSADGSSGFVVELKKLPKDLTHIRFFNSW
jgi:hypothetical protein